MEAPLPARTAPSDAAVQQQSCKSWTLWVKHTGGLLSREPVQYEDIEVVDPQQRVSTLKRRLLEYKNCNADPQLVVLRLVPTTPGVDTDPTEDAEVRASVLSARQSLYDAGVRDGSLLLVHFVGNGVSKKGELAHLLSLVRACVTD